MSYTWWCRIRYGYPSKIDCAFPGEKRSGPDVMRHALLRSKPPGNPTGSRGSGSVFTDPDVDVSAVCTKVFHDVPRLLLTESLGDDGVCSALVLDRCLSA